jgi:phage terminase large subunit GpA-like protein
MSDLIVAGEPIPELIRPRGPMAVAALKLRPKPKMFQARVHVTRVEEWCVEAETAEEARELLAAGGGHRVAAPVVGPTHVDVTEGGKKLRRGARLWTIAVATFKSETYRFLRLPLPTDEEVAAGASYPPCYVHVPRGAEAEWVKQLVGEQLVTVKTKRGFSRLEWQKLRERNEALDCRVYTRAAAWIAGADRWPDARWRDLEQQVGLCPSADDEVTTEPDAVPTSIAGVLRRRPERRNRRVFRSSYVT